MWALECPMALLATVVVPKTELSSSETGSSAEREIFQRKERLFERQMTVITDSLSKTRIHFEILIFI